MESYEHRLKKSLNDYSDHQIYATTGIRDWSQKSLPLTKILDRHSTFPYDDGGIYFIDQLALTYTSQYEHLFFRNPQIFADKEFRTRYNIDKELVLINLRGKEQQYHNLYKLEYLGKYFGDFFLHKTSDVRLSRIQIANEIFYTESPATIIAFLVEVATKLHLQFSNCCNYDVAYDTLVNYYQKILMVYYQSDFCSAAVHKAHNSTPIYTFHGRRRLCHSTVDIANNTIGTFTVGSKNSATDLKIYVKTPEIAQRGKTYITRVHKEFFGKDLTVYRIEGCARSDFFDKSKPFGRMQYDLLDLLIPAKIKTNFRTIIGDKLKFKKIRPIGWDDKNRNPIWERTDIINLNNNQSYRKFDIELPPIIKTKNREVDDFKNLIYRYLDGTIKYVSLITFVTSSKQLHSSQHRNNLLTGIGKARRNYQHPISIKKATRINKLEKVLNGRERNKEILRLSLYLLFFS